MHVVEHIGLGRYGDPLDPDGDMKAISELKRVLAPGGTLLFVTPVGRPRIMFNGHRIYSYEQIESAFAGLKLREFSLVPDNGHVAGIIENAAPALVKEQSYGCGCFWFTREGS
jgi:SAM-dependent methyltransferase